MDDLTLTARFVGGQKDGQIDTMPVPQINWLLAPPAALLYLGQNGFYLLTEVENGTLVYEWKGGTNDNDRG